MSHVRSVGRRISVIGTGYLGAVHAVCMAHVGHHVVAVDTDAERTQELASGSAPFFEPGLQPMLANALASGRLTFTTNYAAVASADVHFVCVGTPQSAHGDELDTSNVLAAFEELVRQAPDGSLLVGKSTVPVGTADRLKYFVSSRRGEGVLRLAWNPEFLREGRAIEDTLRPSRLVYGVDPMTRLQDVRLLDEIFGQTLKSGSRRVVTDLRTAELVKVGSNAFLATKISFINAMADLCEVAGADVQELAEAMGLDERIGPSFLGAGLGFGGGCLPKDIRGLAASARQLQVNGVADFMELVDEINQSRRRKVLALAAAACGGIEGKRVAILGAAFKPDSDDVRDSPALEVASAAEAAGALVTVHDPKAMRRASQLFPRLSFADTAVTACADADIVLHLTEWSEYREIDPLSVGAAGGSRVIVDARNALNADRWREAGWRYFGLGRAQDALFDGLVRVG